MAPNIPLITRPPLNFGVQMSLEHQPTSWPSWALLKLQFIFILLGFYYANKTKTCPIKSYPPKFLVVVIVSTIIPIKATRYTIHHEIRGIGGPVKGRGVGGGGCHSSLTSVRERVFRTLTQSIGVFWLLFYFLCVLIGTHP